MEDVESEHGDRFSVMLDTGVSQPAEMLPQRKISFVITAKDDVFCGPCCYAGWYGDEYDGKCKLFNGDIGFWEQRRLDVCREAEEKAR